MNPEEALAKIRDAVQGLGCPKCKGGTEPGAKNCVACKGTGHGRDWLRSLLDE